MKPHLLLDLSACIHFPLTIATSASRASLMKWFRTLRSQIGLSGDGRLGRVHSNTINSKASSPAITYKKTVTDRLLNIEMEWKLGGLCKEAISSRWGTKFETPLRYLYLCMCAISYDNRLIQYAFCTMPQGSGASSSVHRRLIQQHYVAQRRVFWLLLQCGQHKSHGIWSFLFWLGLHITIHVVFLPMSTPTTSLFSQTSTQKHSCTKSHR